MVAFLHLITPHTKHKILISGGVIMAGVIGFLAGNISTDELQTQVITKQVQPEISIVQLKNIQGDELEMNLSGPVRVVWEGTQFVEGEGEHYIPISQIPGESDLKYRQFKYVGNAKTGKFYPSDTYFARGVEVRHRRFFETRQAAEAKGFVPSKAVLKEFE